MMESGKANCWNRLKDSVGNMDVAQIQFVMSQESVKNVYSEMMGAFNSFLFEKFKEDFSTIPSFKPYVEKYVDAVIKSAEDYGRHAVYLEEENTRLKRELEELKNANRC